MQRMAFVSAVLVCASGLASAQGLAGSMNDLRLHNGAEFLYLHQPAGTTTPGPFAGTSVLPPFTTSDYVWKTFSRDTLRHCSGFMEITAVDFFDYDTDWTVVDSNGFNTALADFCLGLVDAFGPSAPTGTFEPDQTLNTFFSFGNGSTPDVNNALLANPGCGIGYEIQADLTGGLGATFGLPIVANGATDLVYTTFLPGGQIYGVPNTCLDTQGDISLTDAHSSSSTSTTEGETQFDLIGSGNVSCWGGSGTLGATLYVDNIDETYCSYVEFTEPTLCMVVNSNTGHVDPGPAQVPPLTLSNADVGLEEGLAALHYQCPRTTGGKLAARLYAWLGIGRPAAVIGTIAAPLVTCINFKGSKLGLSPTDPLFNLFLGLWQGTIVKTNNQYSVPENTDFDDGVFNTLALPLKAHLIGTTLGLTVKLSFQGFYKTSSATLVGSQITKINLHS